MKFCCLCFCCIILFPSTSSLSIVDTSSHMNILCYPPSYQHKSGALFECSSGTGRRNAQRKRRNRPHQARRGGGARTDPNGRRTFLAAAATTTTPPTRKAAAATVPTTPTATLAVSRLRWQQRWPGSSSRNGATAWYGASAPWDATAASSCIGGWSSNGNGPWRRRRSRRRRSWRPTAATNDGRRKRRRSWWAGWGSA